MRTELAKKVCPRLRPEAELRNLGHTFWPSLYRVDGVDVAQETERN